MKHTKRRYLHLYPGVLILALAACLATAMLGGCGEGSASTAEGRTDLVVIDDMGVFGSLERPAVVFPHDMHTEALKAAGKDCQTCHLKDNDGKLSQKLLRLADDDYQTVMDIYHDNCITCHKETAATGAEAGPITCGECHQRTPEYESVRQPMQMDKSLHYRHIAAHKDSCSLCHHQYDETAQKLVYVEGKEESCRDCHRAQKIDNRVSLRHAAHEACVNCHVEKNQGRQTCAGCHDATQQATIAKLEMVPRLKRNQPDFVLISAADKELAGSKLATVPFSHVGHEGFTDNCRVCHHESLKACNDCHTLQGDTTGAGVKAQRAMHEMNSSHSCVGCHEVQKSEMECAGCHALMEQGRLSEHACTICHAGPLTEDLEKSRSKYTSLDQFRPKKSEFRLSFSDADIPDSVTIKILSDKYEPAVFPHGKIVRALMSRIENNKVATHFHGREDVVCQGCHHHSPIGKRPPLCESCHGQAFNEANLHAPGLYGAYHRQCIGCHEAMGLTKPEGCEGCHAPKKSQ